MSARAEAPARCRRLLPPGHSSAYLEVATLRDVPAIVALHSDVDARLTRDHGAGPWSRPASTRGVRFAMTRSVAYLARERGRVIATLMLSRRKPWAIDRASFAAKRAPLYLTAMAVHPNRQRRGVGRRFEWTPTGT